MSASYYLVMDCGGDAPVGLDMRLYLTYNLGPMLRAADPEFTWEKIVGMTAKDAGDYLEGIAKILSKDPSTFKKYNPSNGWGDYEGLREAVRAFVVDCRTAPKAVVGACL